jgi:cytochrome c biogenesis factor
MRKPVMAVRVSFDPRRRWPAAVFHCGLAIVAVGAAMSARLRPVETRHAAGA